MAYPSLISVSQATLFLGNSVPTGTESLLPSLVSAASRAVQKYCNRIIGLTDFTEIRIPQQGQWDKAQPDYIGLSFYPVNPSPLNPVVTLRGGRTTAIGIYNANTQTAQDAWMYLNVVGDPELGLQTPVGVTVCSVINGVQASNSFPFFGVPSSTGFSVSSATGTTGTIPTGTYLCSYSWLNQAGESVRSADISVNVTAGQFLTFRLPTAIPQATGANVYVSTTNGASSTETVQNSAPITGTTFVLSALVSGATFTTNNYGTLSQLATGINNLGNGWTATVQSPTPVFSNWPSSDLWGSNASTMGCLSTGNQQGLDIFQWRVNGAQTDPETGEVNLPQGGGSWNQGPGNYWQWPGSTDYDLAGSSWRDPILCKYAAGWAIVPEDIQTATLLTVQSMLTDLQTANAYEEETADKWKAKLAGVDERAIPKTARRLLSVYRVPRV